MDPTADYDPAKDGRRQFVDLVVSDLRSFEEDETSQERFRTHAHELFIEVKYFPVGCSKTWRHDHIRKIPSISRDAARLDLHIQRGHCVLGAVLIVDDDGLSVRISWAHPGQIRLSS